MPVEYKIKLRGGSEMKSIRELEKLPESIKQEIIDFADFLIAKNKNKKISSAEMESAVLSQPSLARDWDNLEEDEAWKDLR
jgi:hypothetical protein